MSPTVSKQIFLATAARFLSTFGSGLLSFAIGLYVLSASKSALWFAITQILPPLIALLFSRKIGTLIDHTRHKPILIISQSTNVIIASLYLLLFINSASHRVILFGSLTVILLNAITNTFTQTTYQASVIQIVGNHDVQRLNSLEQSGNSIAQILAPTIGATLFAVSGITFVLAFRVILSIGVIIFLVLLSFSREQGTNTNNPETNDGKINLATILHSPLFAYSVLASVAINLVVALVSTGLPLLMMHTLSFSSQQYGYVETASGFGTFIAGLVLAKTHNFAKPIATSAKAMVLLGSMVAVFGTVSLLSLQSTISFTTFIVVATIYGFSLSLMEIPMSTYMQTNIPINIQGQVFSFMFGASQTAMPLGVIIATMLAQQLGAGLLIAGVLIIIYIATVYLQIGRKIVTA